jgi:RNA polymerase-binding transcription factor DksA
MDLVDRACELEERQRAAALWRVQQEQSVVSTEECIDCGAEIPLARLAVVKASRCVGCQTAHEQLGCVYV